MINRYYVYAFCALLIGCADLSFLDTRPVQVSRPGGLGGIYEGSISLPSGENTTVAIVALDDGETRIVTANGMQMSVSLSGPLNRLRGNGRMFASNTGPKTLADGSTVSPVSVEATFAQRNVITGAYSGRGGSGNFDARYLPLYERPSSLSKLVGTYRSYKQGSSFIGTIDHNGRLSGNDDRGSYEGQLTLLSPTINVYRANVTYRPNGNAAIVITGLATLNDFEKNNDNDLLQMQLSNNQRHFFSQIRRVR